MIKRWCQSSALLLKRYWKGWYLFVFCLVTGSVFHVLNHIKYQDQDGGGCLFGGCFIDYFF